MSTTPNYDLFTRATAFVAAATRPVGSSPLPASDRPCLPPAGQTCFPAAPPLPASPPAPSPQGSRCSWTGTGSFPGRGRSEPPAFGPRGSGGACPRGRARCGGPSRPTATPGRASCAPGRRSGAPGSRCTTPWGPREKDQDEMWMCGRIRGR